MKTKTLLRQELNSLSLPNFEKILVTIETTSRNVTRNVSDLFIVCTSIFMKGKHFAIQSVLIKMKMRSSFHLTLNFSCEVDSRPGPSNF